MGMSDQGPQRRHHVELKGPVPPGVARFANAFEHGGVGRIPPFLAFLICGRNRVLPAGSPFPCFGNRLQVASDPYFTEAFIPTDSPSQALVHYGRWLNLHANLVRQLGPVGLRRLFRNVTLANAFRQRVVGNVQQRPQLYRRCIGVFAQVAKIHYERLGCHKPGDAGYGQPAANYWHFSLYGQVQLPSGIPVVARGDRQLDEIRSRHGAVDVTGEGLVLGVPNEILYVLNVGLSAFYQLWVGANRSGSPERR